MIATLNHRLASFGRFVVLLGVYSVVLFLSLLLALLLRFDFDVEPEFWQRFWSSVVWILPLKLILLVLFGQFRSLLTFFSLPDAKMIAGAMGVAAVIELLVWFAVHGGSVLPRGVLVSDLVISFLALAALRTFLRVYRERTNTSRSLSHGVAKRTAILGSGTAAAQLLRDIQSRPGLGLDVVCLVDDDAAVIGGKLHGQPVMGPLRRLPEIARQLSLQKTIIAMPGAKPALVKQLVDQLNTLGLDHDILPSVPQLLHRQVMVSHLRPVDPADLLGREEVSLDEEGIAAMLRDQVVMVTGAGGSIGSELCRQVASQNPAELILVDRSEPALFSIEQELLASRPHVPLVPRAFNVCDEDQMARLFAGHLPAFVFHAAAHKHVPLMEQQPGEALRNNTIGTEVVARLANAHHVTKFVLVSTDKAVNPTNVMGATKRLAEMVLEEYHVRPDRRCLYSAVRFGNVLGSSGSVVPTFRRQIAEGGPVTVTHPEVTRYFMSIPEAVGLILQCARQAQGGEVFVLDMGEPVKIADLARQMIDLSGFVPEEDIKITFTGLRPGEKLYEEPIHEMENVEPTIHPKVRRLRNNRRNGTAELVAELHAGHRELMDDVAKLRAWLTAKIPEYGPKTRDDS
jgi:FlaA1/EpsC-like NDP-sugar epimerase